MLGLIGPNGAGKTTLFECIAGLTHKDADKARAIYGSRHEEVPRQCEGFRLLSIRALQQRKLFRRVVVTAAQ